MRFNREILLYFFAFLIMTVLSASLCPAQEEEAKWEFQKAVFIDALGPQMTTHRQAEKGIRRIDSVGFDTILLQVRHQGEVFYSSSIEPRSNRIDSGYTDPLLDFILMSDREELEQPIKIFAWISVFPAHSGRINRIPPDGNIMKKHPEWITENYAGQRFDRNKVYHLDPGIPAVQNHIISIIAELLNKYDLDGILLDDFRYPDDGLNWGYNPMALNAFQYDTGLSDKPLPYDPRWCDWRRAQLTTTLEKIYQTIDALKPDVKLYVEGITWGDPPSSNENFKNTPAYSLVLQDWVDWMEKGLADGLLLYNYKQYPQQQQEFHDWLDFAIANCGKERIICGIGGFYNFSNAILNQIRTARKKDVYGVAIYCLRVPSKDNPDLLLDTLSSSTFSENIIEFPYSGITYQPPLTPTPSPTEITSPTLAMEQVSTATVEIVKITPTPLPTIIPALPGLPSPPNLEEIFTPTPIVTDVPPTQTKLPVKTPKLIVRPKTEPELEKPSTPTPAPTPYTTFARPKWDTIYLTNGSTLKGRVLEEVEGKVTIETSRGLTMTLPLSDIEKVVTYR